ncbi:MSC_0621 family F1-like ATPase epsilon subunit [Mesomycoplasma neurolyticum]|uniref:Uncharacterized protein n=1 Tax=Mesomycoplasma neurolyticum TaxID=2120 RepID=A0A449A4N0_9BACT|nr:hypothetical protein [Mesomycoplasma neurolyticum]VEU59189.1 Uncharacterised protein [Mesomycoplasma neurolyticum]
MKNKKNDKQLSKITIYFANNEKITKWNSFLYLYNDEELKWFNLNDLSIANFKYMFIKIIDFTTKNEEYIFLEKCDIFKENDNINIFSTNKKNSYFQQKQYSKKNDKIKILKQDLKELLKFNKIDNSINTAIEIENKKRDIYLETVVNFLKIKKEI